MLRKKLFLIKYIHDEQKVVWYFKIEPVQQGIIK